MTSVLSRVALCRITAPSSPAAGFRSETTHQPKRCKTKTGNNRILDKAVGCNELLARAPRTDDSSPNPQPLSAMPERHSATNPRPTSLHSPPQLQNHRLLIRVRCAPFSLITPLDTGPRRTAHGPVPQSLRPSTGRDAPERPRYHRCQPDRVPNQLAGGRLTPGQKISFILPHSLRFGALANDRS